MAIKFAIALNGIYGKRGYCGVRGASSLFIVAVIFSTVNMIEDYHAEAFEILRPTCVLITFVLLLLAGFLLAEACSNNQGYCRNWTLHI